MTLTRGDQFVLLDIAKSVSLGTAGQFTPDTYPYLAEVAKTLRELAWQRAEVCVACPRAMDNHVCGCPHAQAKKRLTAYGVWPDA